MDVPTIGGTRGVFDIFVPGLFLLINLLGFVYFLPSADEHVRELIADGASNTATALIMAVCFGYLLGIILRLVKTELPDKCSAWWILTFRKRYVRRRIPGEKGLTEQFPYLEWMGKVCRSCYPVGARRFYDKFWAPRKKPPRNIHFFNFCKVLLTSTDPQTAREVYAAEALVRYVAGMFYALAISLVLMLLLLICCPSLWAYLLVILLGYALAIIVILSHYHLMREKEVGTVFAATFKNRNRLLKLLALKKRGRKRWK